MMIGVLRELSPGENRVALVPDVIIKLVKKNINVLVEKNAGLKAGYTDDEFINAGAKIAENKKKILKEAKIICSLDESYLLNSSSDTLLKNIIHVSFMSPFSNPKKIQKIAKNNITSFSMELVPRISRAQSMDALSSQANLTGYKAVILAANHIQKILPMLMTAAGTIPPSKVLILGAGVAGLQAIATAKRLGSVVYAYDVRGAVKEQVESLGGKFVKIEMEESAEGKGGYAKELSKNAQLMQRKKLGKFASGMDIIISTAQIPGRRAPRLLDIDAIKKMKHGSVVIDLATSTGGNIEGSQENKIIDIEGVAVIGATNLPSMLAYNASLMYSQNIFSFLNLILKENELIIDFNDEIIKESCVTHNGKIINKQVLKLLEN